MNKETKEAILQEIANYKKNISAYKPYFESMKEVSLWLQEVES